jgi:hypothetical protein
VWLGARCTRVQFTSLSEPRDRSLSGMASTGNHGNSTHPGQSARLAGELCPFFVSSCLGGFVTMESSPESVTTESPLHTNTTRKSAIARTSRRQPLAMAPDEVD